MYFKAGDQVWLRLHPGYKVLGQASSKYGHQREGPCKVFNRVGRLANKPELPEGYRIRPVISVAQFEPAPKGPDLACALKSSPIHAIPLCSYPPLLAPS